MPTNVTIEYQLAEREYHKAKTVYEKIRALEKMLATAPTHKGTENLRANLTQKLSKLKQQQEKEKKQKSSGYQISVKKEGSAQIVIIGITNSGKSTFLKKLTNAKPLISDYPFTTKLPVVGIMDYNGIKLQIVEIPAIFENFTDSEKGPLFLGIIRQADFVILMLRKNPKKEFNLLINELNKANIKVNERKRDDFISYLKGLVVVNGDEEFEKDGFDVVKINDKELPDLIWKNISLIYVFTKSPSKKRDWPPLALKQNSTVKDLALHVHKDFIKKFKYAKVWGSSSKFEKGQIVGLSHILEQGDIVEIHIK